MYRMVQQDLNFPTPQATEAIACPFVSLAFMPFEYCQPLGYLLPLVGFSAF